MQQICPVSLTTHDKDDQTRHNIVAQTRHSLIFPSQLVIDSAIQKDHINEMIATIQAHLNQTLKHASPHPQHIIIIKNQYWNTINIRICTIRITSVVGRIDAPHVAPMYLSSLQERQLLHAPLTQHRLLMEQRFSYLTLRRHLAAISKGQQCIANVITNTTQTMTQYFHKTCSPLRNGGAA